VPPDLLTLTNSCVKLRMTQQPHLESLQPPGELDSHSSVHTHTHTHSHTHTHTHTHTQTHTHTLTHTHTHTHHRHCYQTQYCKIKYTHILIDSIRHIDKYTNTHIYDVLVL